MIQSPAFAAVMTLFATMASAQPAQESGPPAEPYRMVYSMASTAEVVLLDLNSVDRTGDVAEAWSLAFLAEPTRFGNAPEPAQVFWVRARIDCGAREGQFLRAIGLKDGQPVFDIPITADPTPLEQGWVLDDEFICKGVEATRIAATTLAEATAAADDVMKPDSSADGPQVNGTADDTLRN
ncbi:hypothetical protein [Brevundimonas sp.]|uniref:hypothetical protein n=1 Tax=Brevundimonas sp. TaxID=1871086 RepID=UPI00286C40F3|nr:hypothetical protein [Brevundimonas sp.]